MAVTARGLTSIVRPFSGLIEVDLVRVEEAESMEGAEAEAVMPDTKGASVELFFPSSSFDSTCATTSSFFFSTGLTFSASLSLAVVSASGAVSGAV